MPLPASVGTSLQGAISQQAANRQAFQISYTSQSGKHLTADISQLPPSVVYDPSRDPIAFGVPVLVGSQQMKLYYSNRGKIYNKHSHIYNVNGERMEGGRSYKKAQKDRHRPGGNQKRDNLINVINGGSEDSGKNITSLSTQQSQFQKYLNTYYVVQSKVNALVFPSIQAITNAINDTLIHDVAITACVEIVGLPIKLNGLFQGGINATVWLERQYFNGTNHSIATITAIPNSKRTKDDIAALYYFANYQTLLSTCLNSYHNGIKAANSTGILNTLWTLQEYLMANDTSIISKSFTTVDTYYIKELFPHHINNTIT